MNYKTQGIYERTGVNAMTESGLVTATASQKFYQSNAHLSYDQSKKNFQNKSNAPKQT